MMRIGFFANGPLIKDQEGSLYGASYNDNLMQRYLSFCDEIELCMRLKHQDHVTGLSKITLKNVFFTECIDLTPIRNIHRRGEAVRTIQSVIERCDGIVIRLPSTIGRIAASVCRKLGKPYLVELVGCPWDALWNHSLRGKAIAVPKTLATKLKVKYAPAVLYVTNEFLQKRYPTNGISIGCSDVEFQDVDERVLENRLKRIDEKDGRIVLGTTAAVNVKYKGQFYIIKALGKLKQQGITNYEYQLVGNGDNTFLKSVAEKCNVVDQVKFIGGLPHDDVFKWLDGIDVYVQPSKQEGLPRALVEAMSRGLPAVGSTTGGIPELLDSSCIFPRGAGHTKQIISVLQSMTKEKMIVQAKRNFEVASHYNKYELDKKRNKFYSDFFDNKKISK